MTKWSLDLHLILKWVLIGLSVCFDFVWRGMWVLETKVFGEEVFTGSLGLLDRSDWNERCESEMPSVVINGSNLFDVTKSSRKSWCDWVKVYCIQFRSKNKIYLGIKININKYDMRIITVIYSTIKYDRHTCQYPLLLLPVGFLLLLHSVLCSVESLSLLYLLFISWFICSRRWCMDMLGVFHANQTCL